MIQLDRNLYDEIKKHALECFPEECCGFLLYDVEEDREVVRQVTNVATERHEADPKSFPRDGTDGYIMEERQLLEVNQDIDSGAFELRSIYHSHPNGLARPSATDSALAASDGAIWAIIAVGRITLWRSGDAGFEALPYEVTPR